MYYEYSGDVIFRDLTRYYENGQVWIKANEIGREQTEYYTSFKPDGKYYSYYENGNISSYREYKEGVYHGEFINYYEDGMQRELITYSEGEKNGLYLRNYASGSIEIEGGYINGSPDGVWYKYKENGDPISEIGYKEGINHGIFHQYATGSTQSESIHVTGQYEEGKKTGIWLYGYNNEGYVEKYYYENDIKIWREAGNTRTYYDQEGSVIKEEKIN